MDASENSETNRITQNIENNRVPLSNYTLDPSHVLFLHHSDNPNCSLTNGNNYAQWKRSCEVSLSAKNNMSFVTENYEKLADDSPLLPFMGKV